MPMVMLGTFILAFGWFGFNPGSTLAGTDLRIAVVAVNTMIAGSTAAVAALLYLWWFKTKKPDPSMMCNGMLAGLVAITAPCAFVSAGGAAIIGIVAGVLVVESVFFWDKVGIDDAVGAISVHGVNGCWGCLSIGLFADGTYGDGFNGVAGNVTGLFYGGGLNQFWAEFIGVTTCFVTLSLLSILVYYIAEMLVGNRVSQDVEIEGLDVPEMGVPGYAGMVMDKQSETPMLKG
jgi:Amt family ammonium transporter